MKRRKKNQIKVRYRKLGRERALGQAFIGENLAEVDPRLPDKKKLIVTCHELAHLAFPEACETKILNAERVIGRTLWELGYRLTEEPLPQVQAPPVESE